MSNKIDKIKIFDDVLDYSFREDLYSESISLPYKIGWQDREDKLEHKFLHSKIPKKWLKSKFIPQIQNEELKKIVDGKKIVESVINCSFAGETYFPHSHFDNSVFLYYVNLEWNREWYGETEFYSEDLNEIIFSNPYVPGRVIWFDGQIPHSVKPQSFIGPKYRFTLSIFFDKGESEVTNFLNPNKKMDKLNNFLKKNNE